MNFRDIEDNRLKICKDSIDRLQRYSESKNNDMFDILYNSHINLILKLLHEEKDRLLDIKTSHETREIMKTTMEEIIKLLSNKYSDTKFKFRNDHFVVLIHDNPYLQNCEDHDAIADIIYEVCERHNDNGILDDFMSRFCIRYEESWETKDVDVAVD